MKKFLALWMGTVILSSALAACSEQREKVADLFRWGQKTPTHEIRKVDPRAAEDLDMTRMTVESLQKEGVKMTEISPGSLFVSTEKQQISGVRTGTVQHQNLEKRIRTVGRVDYDEKKIFAINPKIGGWIEELYVDYTGKMVRKGQPLLALYSPELVSAQEELLLALKVSKTLKNGSSDQGRAGGDRLLEAARKRLLLWDITPRQIENLEKAGEIRKTLVLFSPADGFVMEKNVFQGMAVAPGMTLYKVGDLSRVWVLADIYEYELPFLQVGQKALITLAYSPGESFEGTATYLYPSLDPKTRTVKVRFDLPNPEFKLKPEMWVNVELKIPLGQKLVVPEDAVMDSGTMQMVFVDRGQGYFESRHIQVGYKVQGYYEVISGLTQGERVVTSANFLIDSESQLKSAGGMGGHQH
jgi:membrane fusion protein, copper/silver efflux system